MADSKTDPTIKDFEAAIAELDGIVRKLEEGDLALEKSLELYERGVQLSRFCHSRLEEAERRIEIVNERGELKPAPASLRLPDDEDDQCDSTSGSTDAVEKSRRRSKAFSTRRPRLLRSSPKRCGTASSAAANGYVQ